VCGQIKQDARANKVNKEMLVRTCAVLMKKSPGVVSVTSALRTAPPAATEVDSDGDAEDDKKRSQEFLVRWQLSFPLAVRAP
jgi:hypothetical protein